MSDDTLSFIESTASLVPATFAPPGTGGESTTSAVPQLLPISEVVLPYGMKPAPAKAPRRSRPVDLGGFSEGEWAGYCIVFNLDVELGLYDVFKGLEDTKGVEAMDRMRHYLASICVAWNLVYTAEDGKATFLLPQPQDNGMGYVKQDLIGVIGKAFAEVMKAPKEWVYSAPAAHEV